MNQNIVERAITQRVVPADTLTKKAIELEPGDEIVVGYRFPYSLYTGTVKTTTVVDAGVQVNMNSGHFTCGEDEVMGVKA